MFAWYLIAETGLSSDFVKIGCFLAVIIIILISIRRLVNEIENEDNKLYTFSIKISELLCDIVEVILFLRGCYSRGENMSCKMYQSDS